jgi:hypothetical protein
MPAVTTAGATLTSSGATAAAVVDEDFESDEHDVKPTSPTMTTPARQRRNVRVGEEVDRRIEHPFVVELGAML